MRRPFASTSVQAVRWIAPDSAILRLLTDQHAARTNRHVSPHLQTSGIRAASSAAPTNDDARTRLQRRAAPEAIQLIGLEFWLGSAFLHTTSPSGGSRPK